ncbi:hypothetical protein Tco_0711685 [Tanacetum coccineum]
MKQDNAKQTTRDEKLVPSDDKVKIDQANAQRAALWHAISDTQRENQELRLQIAEERRARLDLAEIVDSMRRGQEPRGDV